MVLWSLSRDQEDKLVTKAYGPMWHAEPILQSEMQACLL
jgi:hypothetical protein